MTHLLGVAFSSPAVVPLLIDNSQFLIHTFTGRESHYKDYLSVQEETRQKVVLVPSVKKLQNAVSLDKSKEVSVFMLFDRAEILDKIDGCSIIDGEQHPDNPGYWNIKKEKITKDKLNALLVTSSAEEKPFAISQDVISEAAILEPSVFDFIGQVIMSIPEEVLPSEEKDAVDISWYNKETFKETFTEDTIGWICGVHHARLWILRYKKKLIQIGANEELVLDLYRFCSEGQAALSIWRAYHDIRNGDEIREAASKYEAHPLDVEKCVQMFPVEEKREYRRVPEDEE